MCVLNYLSYTQNTSKLKSVAEIPFYLINIKLQDTLVSILKSNKFDVTDSCFVIHINTMDSSGKLLQIVLLPKKKCFPEIYDFYIDNTLGITFIDSIIILIYGRSKIDKSLANQTNSLLFVRIKKLDINTIENSDEYFPKTYYIDFRNVENKNN